MRTTHCTRRRRGRRPATGAWRRRQLARLQAHLPNQAPTHGGRDGGPTGGGLAAATAAVAVAGGTGQRPPSCWELATTQRRARRASAPLPACPPQQPAPSGRQRPRASSAPESRPSHHHRHRHRHRYRYRPLRPSPPHLPSTGPHPAVHLLAPLHGHRGADGSHAAAHQHQRQHQGATRLLVRALLARRRSGGQRAPHPRAPWRHAGGGAVPARPLGGRPARRGCAGVQPPAAGGRLPPAGHHGHHARLPRRQGGVLGRIARPPRRHWRRRARLHAPAVAAPVAGGRCHRRAQAGAGRSLPGGCHHGGAGRTRGAPWLLWLAERSRQHLGPQGAGGCQPQGHRAGARADRGVRAGGGAGVHGAHSGQCRGGRACHACALLQARGLARGGHGQRLRLHGRRDAHQAHHDHRQTLPQRRDGLRGHWAAGAGQHQRPPGRHLLGGHLRAAVPGGAGHSSQPGLPLPDRHPHPTRLHPQPVARCRRGRRQRAHLPAGGGRGSAGLPCLCSVAGLHQQLHLRRCLLRLLRNDRRWRRCRASLARAERRAHAHDQHTHHGRGDHGAAVPSPASAVRSTKGHWWAWSLPRWVRRGARCGIPTTGDRWHPERASGLPTVRAGGGRARHERPESGAALRVWYRPIAGRKEHGVSGSG
mmetsp:Transcript_28908/g.94115  ORF Transcript_28908/g.94115 Transcript_28908/m.94115 type:complete len:648 (+) Transcript_28908:854-2797(+)